MLQTALFNPLNTYFDHIYVITLERALERQEKIKEVLNGLHYTFFFGSDKKNYEYDYFGVQGIYDDNRAKHFHRYGKSMNAGQICCSWSHKSVYEDMIAKQYDRILILEDDVCPISAALVSFPQIVGQLPKNWQLLYFDYAKNVHRKINGFIKQYFYHIQKAFGGLKWSHKGIRHLYARPYSTHLKRAGYHDYSSAYAITRTAAQKLIALQTPIAFAADTLLSYACINQLVNGYISIPSIFSQSSQTDKAGIGSYVED